jgi:hypothetical protein
MQVKQNIMQSSFRLSVTKLANHIGYNLECGIDIYIYTCVYIYVCVCVCASNFLSYEAAVARSV